MILFVISDPRFWRKVDRTGGADACWPWLGYRNPAGYGMLQRRKIHGAPILAPRYVLYLITGALPIKQALHSCDNPICVNPAHIREGDQAENIADAITRHRHVPPPRMVGNKHPNRKLSAELLAVIRRRLAAGDRHRDIATDLGVARTTVTAVNRGQNWSETK